MKLNLIEGIHIQIGGETGKYNTLPVEVLVKLAENLQKLVKSIAKYELDTPYELDFSNFNIELSGFKKGSAVPAFVLTPRVKFTVGEDGVAEQRNFVNKRFNDLMEIADKGDYMKLKYEYKSNLQRNAIVTSLSEFTNSAGKSPIAFAEFSNSGEIKTVGNINRVKPNVLKELVVEIKKEESSDEGFGVGTIKYFKSSSGKKRKKIVEDFEDKEAVLSYSTNEIQFMGRVYVLNSSINCRIEKEDDYFVIEHSILDIVGTGLNIEYAKLSFAEEFDFIYKRYNELKEEELTSRTKLAKDFINLIVKEIK